MGFREHEDDGPDVKVAHFQILTMGARSRQSILAADVDQ